MIGIDEVGRGAWAGPLLVVASRLKKDHKLPLGLKDSKKLSKIQRDKLAADIVPACDIGQGWVSADMIDSLGLSQALSAASLLALMQIDAAENEPIVIDGNINFIANSNYKNVITKVKADDSEPLVSASSIVAKVLRDELMAELAGKFPQYGFEAHVGYGTRQHILALQEHGTSPIHRQSVKPVALLQVSNDQQG